MRPFQLFSERRQARLAAVLAAALTLQAGERRRAFARLAGLAANNPGDRHRGQRSA